MSHTKTRSSRGEVPWHPVSWHLSDGKRWFSDWCDEGYELQQKASLLEPSPLIGQTNNGVLIGDITLWQCRGRRQHISLLAEAYEDGWVWDRNFWPTGVALVLDLTLTYYVQFELMGAPCRSTSKHNLSQWFGVMPITVCFFLSFSFVYYIKCVILCWLYSRIHKKSNNVNVYSIWVRFLSLLLWENNDLWAFQLR